MFNWSQSSLGMNSPPCWCLSQSVQYIRPLFLLTRALNHLRRAGTDPKRVSRLGGKKIEIAGKFVAYSVFKIPVSNSSACNSSNRSWKRRFIQPVLPAVNVDHIGCQFGLIQSSLLTFSTQVLVFIGNVQTVSTAH